jgi:hypothetical protein
MLATTGGDGRVRFWSTAHRDPDLLPGDSQDEISQVAFTAGGKRLVSTSVDGTIRIWDPSRWRVIDTLPGRMGSIMCLSLSPDGRLLAAGNHNRMAKLWDLPHRRLLATLSGTPRPGGDNDRIAYVTISPDGRYLALKHPADDHTVILWEVATRRTVATLRKHTEFISGLVFSPDSRTLVTTSHDLQTVLWEVPSGRMQAVLTGPRLFLGGPVFSPDGRLLAVVCGDNRVHVWDVASRRPVAVLRGHADQISSIAISPDKKTVAGASTEQTIRLWSLATGLETLELRDQQLSSFSLAFAPDGRTLASGRTDGKLHLWRSVTPPEAEAAEADVGAINVLHPCISVQGQQVTLQWPAVPGAAGYNLYRGAGAGMMKLNPQPLAVTTFTDTPAGLSAGHPVPYAVAPLFPAPHGQLRQGPLVRGQANPGEMPPGWIGSSLNEGSVAGSARFPGSAGEILLQGASGKIWYDTDHCYFLNRSVTGDFRVSVRALTRPGPTDDWAQAGLMVRESLDPGARHVSLIVTQAHGVDYKLRPTPHGNVVEQRDPSQGGLKLPITLRLTRRGQTMTAECSRDRGKSFRAFGTPYTLEAPLPATLNVGLAIASYDPGRMTSARFADLVIEPLEGREGASPRLAPRTARQALDATKARGRS